jgi:hypothetical protein
MFRMAGFVAVAAGAGRMKNAGLQGQAGMGLSVLVL